MKLFGWSDPDPVAVTQQSVDLAQQKHKALGVQLKDAEKELSNLKAAAVSNAMEYEHVVDGGVEIAAAAATVSTLEGAVARANADLAAAQAKLAEAKDAHDRQRSITEINTIITAIDEPLKRLLVALTDLTAAVKRGANISLDAKSLLGFLELASAELPVASAATVTALKHAATLIELGSSPTRLPVPEAKPIAVMAAPASTRAVVVKHDVKWSDASGGVRYCHAFWDAPLPPHLAERAISAGIAVDAASDEAQKLRQQRLATANAVDLNQCCDLDTDPPTTPEPRGDVWINPSGVPKWSDRPGINTAAVVPPWMRPRAPTSETY